MNGRRFVGGGIIGVLLALVPAWHTTGLAGQVLQRPMPDIQSLTEAGEGLSVRQKSAETGVASFASTDGRGVLLAMPASAPAEARARSFMAAYGTAFGVSDNSELALLRTTPADSLGVEHVRFQQRHLGVPVVAGELVVHLRGARVIAVNGHIVGDLPVTVAAAIPPADALRLAGEVVAKLNTENRGSNVTYSEPRLEVLDKSVFEPTFVRPRAAWFVEASGSALREFIWVDAETGAVLHHYSQLTDARVRSVYSAGNTSSLPGSLVRSEGGAPTGDADADRAYDYVGATYDYYAVQHGRDSYDAAGATIKSTVHYCPSPCFGNYQNAFWNGSQMVFGNGFSSADDVVAHELTHAVTERSANLVYSGQSGALNESFSDIFGETVDLTDGYGNDAPAVRWRLGEDLSVGAVRDMYNPGVYGHPGKMSDPNYACSAQDNGGVHTNSGIPNHAYALMVDGGTYNGRSITGIGLTKAGKIQYRALTTYLTSTAKFLDAYNALNQSCSDLVGASGITGADCAQVKLALDAVEMDRPPSCGINVPAPPLCPTGVAPARTVFADGFENTNSGLWTPASTSLTNWGYATGRARAGTYSLVGPDPGYVSDHRALMTTGVSIPTGARLYFDSAFDFESTLTPYDGGVLEYSTDGGTNWIDGGNLIEAGQAYNGTIIATYGNPLGSRRGFAYSSLGYTGTRVNLATLAGQTAKFRFRIGTDVVVGALGWSVDNVAIYQCDSDGPPAAFGKVSPLDGAIGQPSLPAVLTWQASAGATHYEYCVDTTNDGACAGPWPSTTSLSATLAPLAFGTIYYWEVRAVNGAGTTHADGGSWWSFTTGEPSRINVAAAANGGIATGSSEHSAGFAASGAINGERAGLNWGNGGGWNDATPEVWGDYLQVAFVSPQWIDEIDVFSVQDNYRAPTSPTLEQTFSLYGVTDFQVQTWSGTQWVTVPGGVISGNTQVWRQVTFAPVLTTGIRIWVSGALNTWSRITELEAYSVGSSQAPRAFGKLTPVNGATGQPYLPAVFTWQASAGATRYEYCVDTTNDDACATPWSSTT
ncbi:MAG: M4 family metallopeptidase, partial [Vicinamibacterales bacterium]